MSTGSLGDNKGKPRVIIVGAGLAGISAGIALKKQLRFDNFTIYEKADAVGGTWRDNTYPGCGSDIPGHWYSLSTELNPRWSSYYVNQPEIRAYWESLYHKHNLPTHTRLNTSVHSAEWNNEAQRYTVVLEDSLTGKHTETEAEVVILAIGGFMNPVFPKDVPGAESFGGLVWHSARWRHDVDLKGKRVGVIGNGCSAAQFVPEISADPSVKVINFCRTPQWYVPRGNYRYPAWVKWMFAHVPFFMRSHRNWIMARSDISFLIFRKDFTGVLNMVRKQLTRYIKYKAPKDQLEKLIPKYPPGCKRIIVDPGYLGSLKRPNVSLKWDAIEAIVQEGIKLKTGEIVPLDVIIFGTGYSIDPVDLRVQGSTGSTMREYFASQGGATAYIGSCIPGFPNCYMLLGPNVASGHASVIFSQEAQIQFALQLIKPIIDNQAKSFEVKTEPTDEYNRWLQGRLSRSVWTECNSYYQADGKNKAKIVATFPGPVTLFWWMTRKPRWDHFKTVGAERWAKQQRTVRKWNLLTLLLVLVVGLGFFFPDPIKAYAAYLPSLVADVTGFLKREGTMLRWIN